MSHYDHEESFHSKDKKQFRKERRIAQKLDRSKFKKTDQEAISPAAPIDARFSKGRVISISGEGAWVDVNGASILCSLKGLMKKETLQMKNLLAVGDVVYLSSDGAIEQIGERRSILSRMDISGKKQQLIAVNVDQVIITVSVVAPPLKPALIDRYLIAAEKGNIQPILAITKIDLLGDATVDEKKRYEEFLAAYEMLGFPILSLSIPSNIGLDALRSLMQNKTSVFSGQSGVGKSSLLNACFDLNQRVGDLAAKTAKGTHTTTSAQLLVLPGGGYCVDTPGIRSFAIWDLTKEDVALHFREFAPYKERCKYPDCAHLSEPQCAVIKACNEGKIASLRYESYTNLLAEIQNGDQARTWS